MKIVKLIPDLPFDTLNIILQYDGRIKYLHKKRLYVNIISKNDSRYNIIETHIKNKIHVINHFYSENENGNINRNNDFRFYIDVFYKNPEIGLIFSKKML